jgi:hypothetical protein
MLVIRGLLGHLIGDGYWVQVLCPLEFMDYGVLIWVKSAHCGGVLFSKGLVLPLTLVAALFYVLLDTRNCYFAIPLVCR